MDLFVKSIIKEKLASKGLKEDKCLIDVVRYRIDKEDTAIEVGNSFLILTAEELGMLDYARLTIESEDNHFQTSPIEFRYLNQFRRQAFENDIQIKAENNLSPYRTGYVFNPFTIEFLKITPLYPKKKEEDVQDR